MREQELRPLWREIFTQARAKGKRLSDSEWEKLVGDRLPALLKARYAAEDVRLSDESKQAIIGRAIAAVREKQSQTAETVETQTRQQWQEITRPLAPQLNGWKMTVGEWVVRVIRGQKETAGDDRDEATRPYPHTPILPYAVGAAVVALLIIALLIWRGQGGQSRNKDMMAGGHPKPRPQAPAPKPPKSPEGAEKPKDISPQPQPPKSPTGLKQPSPGDKSQPTQPTPPTTPQGEGYLVKVPIGTFVQVVGTPNVRHSDAKTEHPQPKTVVYLGDRIYTGDADRAEIQFNDGTTLWLNFNTTIEIPKPETRNPSFAGQVDHRSHLDQGAEVGTREQV